MLTVFALHWDGGGEAASAVAGDDGDGWGEAGGDGAYLGKTLLPFPPRRRS